VTRGQTKNAEARQAAGHYLAEWRETFEGIEAAGYPVDANPDRFGRFVCCGPSTGLWIGANRLRLVDRFYIDRWWIEVAEDDPDDDAIKGGAS
jgi:hypothetical protein